jgi:hypothetical protein
LTWGLLPALAIPGGSAAVAARLPIGLKTLGFLGTAGAEGVAYGGLQYAKTPQERKFNMLFGGTTSVVAPPLAALAGRGAAHAIQAGKAAVTTPLDKLIDSNLAQKVASKIGTKANPELGNQVLQTLKQGSAARQGASPAQQAIIQQGEKHGVNVYYPDIGGPTAAKVAVGQESVPLLGMTGPRMQQQAQAERAAERQKVRLQKEMIGKKFEHLDVIEQIAKGDGPRAEAAQKLLDDMIYAGDEWQSIIQASGNAKLFTRKLVADRLYDNVQEIADGLGYVPATKSLQELQRAIAELKRVPSSNKKTIGKLQDIYDDFVETVDDKVSMRNLSYSDLRLIRTNLSDQISDALRGKNAAVGTNEARYLQKIKSAIDLDLNHFANTKSPELKKAWREADDYYKTSVVPYKNAALAKVLKNEPPEKIYGAFVKRSSDAEGKFSPEAARFYNMLDEKGKAAVRYGIVRNAFEKSKGDRGIFSPATFATEIKNSAPAVAAFFKGEKRQELLGFQKLMRAIEQSGRVASNPPTGKQIMTGAAGTYGLAIDPITIGTIATQSFITTKLFTTKVGREFLLRAAKAPNAKETAKVFYQAAPYLNRLLIQEKAREQY